MKRFLAAALLFVSASCAPRSALLPQAPAVGPMSLRQHDDHIQTMRAQFSATLTTVQNTKRAQGVLLVHKPDRFRLRLWSSFNITVMDYLSVGRRVRLDLPMSQKVLFDSEVDASLAFHAADLRAAFLRGADAYPPPCQESGPTDSMQIQCRSRLIRLRNGDLLDETDSDEQGKRITTTYGNVQDIDGVRMPFAITIEYPRERVKLEVVVGRYEINPDLSEDLFRQGDWPPS